MRIRSLDVVSAIFIVISQWRLFPWLFPWLFAVVSCCLGVTSLPGNSPDISNMAAYTGKLFYTSFRSHPVYGSRDVSIEVSTDSVIKIYDNLTPICSIYSLFHQ